MKVTSKLKHLSVCDAHVCIYHTSKHMLAFKTRGVGRVGLYLCKNNIAICRCMTHKLFAIFQKPTIFSQFCFVLEKFSSQCYLIRNRRNFYVKLDVVDRYLNSVDSNTVKIKLFSGVNK